MSEDEEFEAYSTEEEDPNSLTAKRLSVDGIGVKVFMRWEKGGGMEPLLLTVLRVEGLESFRGHHVFFKVWFGEEESFTEDTATTTNEALHKDTAIFDQQLQLSTDIDEILRIELHTGTTLLCRGRLDLEDRPSSVSEYVLPLTTLSDPPPLQTIKKEQEEAPTQGEQEPKEEEIEEEKEEEKEEEEREEAEEEAEAEEEHATTLAEEEQEREQMAKETEEAERKEQEDEEEETARVQQEEEERARQAREKEREENEEAERKELEEKSKEEEAKRELEQQAKEEAKREEQRLLEEEAKKEQEVRIAREEKVARERQLALEEEAENMDGVKAVVGWEKSFSAEPLTITVSSIEGLADCKGKAVVIKAWFGEEEYFNATNCQVTVEATHDGSGASFDQAFKFNQATDEILRLELWTAGTLLCRGQMDLEEEQSLVPECELLMSVPDKDLQEAAEEEMRNLAEAEHHEQARLEREEEERKQREEQEREDAEKQRREEEEREQKERLKREEEEKQKREEEEKQEEAKRQKEEEKEKLRREEEQKREQREKERAELEKQMEEKKRRADEVRAEMRAMPKVAEEPVSPTPVRQTVLSHQPPSPSTALPVEFVDRNQYSFHLQQVVLKESLQEEVIVSVNNKIQCQQAAVDGRLLLCKNVSTSLDSSNKINIMLSTSRRVLGTCVIEDAFLRSQANGVWCDVTASGAKVGVVFLQPMIEKQPLNTPHALLFTIERCVNLPAIPTIPSPALTVRLGGKVHTLPKVNFSKNPIWNHEVACSVDRIGTCAVVECSSDDVVMGVAEISACDIEGEATMHFLPKVDDSKGMELWHRAGGDLGTITVGWRHVKDHTAKEEEKRQRRSTKAAQPLSMRMNVEAATNLAPLNVGEHNCKAQAKVMVNGSIVGKSSVIKGLSPTWGYEVDVPLTNELSEVKVQLFNDALCTVGDGFLGEVSFEAFEGCVVEWRSAPLSTRKGFTDDLKLLNKYGTLGEIQLSCSVEPADQQPAAVPTHSKPLAIDVNIAEVQGFKNLPLNELIWVVVEAAGQTFATEKMPHSEGGASFWQQDAKFHIEPQAARNFKGTCTVMSTTGKVAACTVSLGASTEFRRVALRRTGKQTAEGTVLIKFDCPHSARPQVAPVPVKSVYLRVTGAENLTSGDFTDQCTPHAVVYQCRNGYSYPSVVLPEDLDFPICQGPASDRVSHMRTEIGNGTSPTWNSAMEVLDTTTPSSTYLVAVFDKDVFVGSGTVKIDHSVGGKTKVELQPRSDVSGDERRRRFNNGTLGTVAVEWTVLENLPLSVMVSPVGWDLPSTRSLKVKYSVSGRSGHTIFTSKLQTRHADHNPSNQEAPCDNNPIDFTTLHGSDTMLYASIWEGTQLLCQGSVPLTATACDKLMFYKKSDRGVMVQCGSVSIRCKWQDTTLQCKKASFVLNSDNKWQHVVESPVLGVTPNVALELNTTVGFANDIHSAVPGDVIAATEKCEAVLLTDEGLFREGVEKRNWVTVMEAKSLADNTQKCYAVLCDNSSTLWSTRITYDSTWNEAFSFPQAHGVRIQVFNYRGLFLGECQVPVGRGDEWLILRARNNSEDDDSIRQRNRGLGAVHLSWNLSPYDAPQLQPETNSEVSEVGEDVEDAKYCVSYVHAVNGPVTQAEGITVAKVKGKVYSFGGLFSNHSYQKNVLQYDTTTRQWKPAAKQAPLRHGHSTVVYKGRVYLFGGFGPGGFDRRLVGLREKGSLLDDDSTDAPKKQGYHMSTWAYDPATLEWDELATEGSALDYRIGHSATVVNHKMIVWGGWKVLVQETSRSDHKTYRVIEHRRNDMCYLNLEEQRWKKIKQKGDVPAARCSHTITKHGVELVLFGGCSEELGPAGPPSSLGNTQSLEDEDEDDLLSTAKPAASGKKAPVHHNVDSSITALNDVYVFDLGTRTWSKRRTNGHRPSGRYGHSTVMDPSGASLLVVGGWGNTGTPLHSVFQLHLESWFWRKIKCWSSRPLVSRLGHGVAVLQSGGNALDALSTEHLSTVPRQPMATPLFQLVVTGGVAQEPIALPTPPSSTSSNTSPAARYKPRSGVPQGTMLLNFSRVGMVNPTWAERASPLRVRTASRTTRPVSRSSSKAELRTASRAEKRATLKASKASPKPPKEPKRKKKKQTQEELDVVISRLTTRVTKRQFTADQLRAREQAENAAKRMTMEEMRLATDRLYYTPMRRAMKKDEVVEEHRGKRLKESEQEEHIERMYYKAKEDSKQAIELAIQKQQVEFAQSSLHKHKTTMQDQMDITERLHYKALEAQQSPKFLNPTKPAPTMTQTEWTETIKRLYTPTSHMSSVFAEDS